MKGKLFGIGVGPGSPDLLTIKSVNVLKEIDVLAYPKASESQSSTSYNIVKDYLGKDCTLMHLVLPMTSDKDILMKCHQKSAEDIAEKLRQGLNVAFITLGDPSFYSTYTYIGRRIEDMGFETEIIPGITSFSASSAVSGVSITEGDEIFSIIPGTADFNRLVKVVAVSDSIVIMKLSANFKEITDFLREDGLLTKAIMVERCGMEGQKIIYDLSNYQGVPGYFAVMIIRKKN